MQHSSVNLCIIFSILCILYGAVVSVSIPISTEQNYSFEQHLATKTPYTSSHLKKRAVDSSPPPSCRSMPIHMNLVARHGSRGPVSGDWIKFEKLESSLGVYGKFISNTEYDWMKKWENPYLPDNSGQLSFFGEQEHYNMSKRFLQRYPDLWSPKYSALLYPIQSTQIPRTSQSGSAFAYGLFEGRGNIGNQIQGGYQPVYSFSDTLDDDIHLYFFDNCPNFVNNVDRNISTKAQAELWLNSRVNRTVNAVKKALGVTEEQWPLDHHDISHMYKACLYDIAVKRDSSRFCKLFDKEDFEMMEYFSDLEDFYQRGYGSKLGHSISCPLLVDFMDKIDSVINSPLENPQRSFLRFAHAETIIPFVTLLGLFDDGEELYWNSEPEVIANRKWRMSVASPFSANVAFVLYNCSSDSDNNSYRVKLLHNEEEVPFPRCGGEMYCPLEKLKAAYAEELKCDFKGMCGISDDNNNNDPNIKNKLPTEDKMEEQEKSENSESSSTSNGDNDNNNNHNDNNDNSRHITPGMVILASIMGFAFGVFGTAVIGTLYWKIKMNDSIAVMKRECKMETMAFSALPLRPSASDVPFHVRNSNGSMSRSNSASTLLSSNSDDDDKV